MVQVASAGGGEDYVPVCGILAGLTQIYADVGMQAVIRNFCYTSVQTYVRPRRRSSDVNGWVEG